jgi:hypothetical protein
MRQTLSDRATLLRLLDAARETQRDAILAWRKRGAELDAARAELAEVREALITADLKIRSFPGADQSDVEFIRAALKDRPTPPTEQKT